MATRDTYTKQTWENLPSETTPVSAERLEHIEQGIKDAADKRALRDVYGDSTLNLGRSSGATVGSYSATIGQHNKATGMLSISFGESNDSTGYGAVSIGGYCLSSAQHSFTLGYGATASQNFAIATGRDTEAKHYFSYAGGHGCVTGDDAQCALGKYNKQTTGAVVIGGGTSDTGRKNIHTIDWTGNAYFAGDVSNGAGVSLNSLKSDVDNMAAIAAGGAIAKVFDTKADLDTWLAVEGNAETLVVGQNIYIKAKDTPDYWWDGTGLQVLETDKVEIESMTYDETMAILNATAEEVA